jgi:hypothetical protein
VKKTGETGRKPMAFAQNGGIEESPCQTMECVAIRWKNREAARDAPLLLGENEIL